MNPIKLKPVAENIRLKIKTMIPELSQQNPENCAESLKTEKNGNKTYGGDLLAEQISLISRQLPIPDPDCLQQLGTREKEDSSFRFLRVYYATGVSKKVFMLKLLRIQKLVRTQQQYFLYPNDIM
ncbi:hypothetical protein N7481_010340 [Penicillium waksmanii]|uniref:uncharacterized protein n=1 Tax=Penicillium waksmanii TaxID=69791 RepID=UPI002549B90B|nr:uncharacterized protein N7481_010340 [Penicillium waksmanii]KAJ5976633.1 hypothetical protein N7481_010340 [Penicillium waksmanii]